jgi:hypothetical protein
MVFMKKYSVKVYADWDRRLKEKTKTIEAKDDEEAWILAWKTFPEYKQLGVIELREGDT